MTRAFAVLELSMHEEKLAALKKSLDTLYGLRATITTEILAKHAVRNRNLNIHWSAMLKFIYDLTPEERLDLGMPQVMRGKYGTPWYRKDGSPNRPQ